MTKNIVIARVVDGKKKIAVESLTQWAARFNAEHRLAPAKASK